MLVALGTLSGCLAPQSVQPIVQPTYQPTNLPVLSKTEPPAPTKAATPTSLQAASPDAFPAIFPPVTVPEPDAIQTVQKLDDEPKPLPDKSGETKKTDPKKKDDRQPPKPPSQLPPIQGTTTSTGGSLQLEEVLAAVDRNYPLLRAIEQERAIAGGRLISAMGAFDLNLNAGLDGQGTTYDSFRSSVGVSQLIPVNGLSAVAGYRNGYGEFPTYQLGQKTANGGEFRVGLNIPLLRDREIDRPRAAIQQAQIDSRLAEPTIDRQRLDFQRAAARSYWAWLAAGMQLNVVEDLVKLAVERDEQLKDRTTSGAAKKIDRIDNQQNIALRNSILVQAQRTLQQATIDLSLFLRDANGNPTLAGQDRLPTFPEIQPFDVSTFEASLQRAFQQRPELLRLQLQREKTAVDLQLAGNQTLPSLNATVSAAQDVGFGKSSLSGPNSLERSTLAGGMTFALPAQRREARGRVLTAQAQLAQIELQIRNTQDTIRAEVQDAYSAIERAYELYQQSRARVGLAREVAEAERIIQTIGSSDILRITLREQAAFEAELIEIHSRQLYFRAITDFRAIIGDGRSGR
jgi:outer membrane protein, heavy metal efflux system